MECGGWPCWRPAINDGGVKIATVPDEGSYERDDLSNDMMAKWEADDELPEASRQGLFV